MDNVDSENGLAMVIAHEMAHIDNRDPAAGMGRAFAIQLMIASISGGYSQDLSEILSNIGLNQFSQEQEREADLLALEILNDHYGHVGGRDEFFKKVNELEKDEESEADNGKQKDNDIPLPAWLSSHPDTEKRIAYLEEQSGDKGYSIGELTALPDNIQEALSKALP